MTRSFLDEALRERNRLQAELEASDAYRRLQLLEGLIAAYQGKEASSSKARRIARGAESGAMMSARALPSTKIQDIVHLAIDCIEKEGGAASKRQIHDFIAAQGMEVSDAALSGYLSKSFQLRYDATKGWMKEDPDHLKQGLRRADIVHLRESTASEPATVEESQDSDSGNGLRQTQALWASEGGF